jgi:hypothetical protein
MRAGPGTTPDRAAESGSTSARSTSADGVLVRADRLYALLLWLLPGRFRREFGAAMRQTFADVCAATVRTRGLPGLLPVLARALADVAGGAVDEWTATLFTRDRWHRSAAAGACLLAGLLVLYSQLRYPANLTRIDYLAQYLLLLAVLVALGHEFVRGGAVSQRAVGCALLTVPGWLAGYRLPLAAAGVVAGLILAGAAWEAYRGGPRFAGLRAGLTTGVLAGVTVLTVNLAGALFGMGGLLQDADHRAEFLRSGQLDPAAYVIGQRINGGAILLFACAVTGALLGLAAGVIPAARATWRAGRAFR